MSTAEIYSKLTPKTQSYTLGAGGAADLTWQDILLAMQGCKPEHQAFMLYVYADDHQSRHSFFAGLFMRAMEDPTIKSWREMRKQQKLAGCGAIEALCLLAVVEWSDRRDAQGRPEGRLTHEARARFMGVSRSTWNRKYKTIYQIIVSVPAGWESTVMRKVNKRLR